MDKCDKLQYIRYGVCYGYHYCCIMSFCRRTFNEVNCGIFQDTDKEGFIPCNNCYDALLKNYQDNYSNKMKYWEFRNEHAWDIYREF